MPAAAAHENRNRPLARHAKAIGHARDRGMVRFAMAVDARLPPSRGPHANARLRGDARDCHGSVHGELAAGVVLRSRGRSAFGGVAEVVLLGLSLTGFDPPRKPSIRFCCEAEPEFWLALSFRMRIRRNA